MMPDLMRDHIGLGEVTRRPKAAFEFLIEVEIDVNLFVTGAVKRTHGRLTQAAAREEHELGVVVALTVLPEQVLPAVLCGGEDRAHELLEIILASGLRMLDGSALMIRAGVGTLALSGRDCGN